MTALPQPLGSDRGRRPRRPTGDDRERAILATAEALLAERPVTEVSVDDLAKGAGISRPTFYFYFPSKEAVVLALLDRVAEEARARRNEALAAAGEDAPQLWRNGVASILETFRAHQPVMRAVAQMLGESEDMRTLWAEVMEGFVADTAAAIESERARGVALDGPPPRQLAVALNWMNERVLHTALSGQEPYVPDDEAVDLLLTIWSRAIYGDDSLGGTAPAQSR